MAKLFDKDLLSNTEVEDDNLGGKYLSSDVYSMIVKSAYIRTTEAGAKMFEIVFSDKKTKKTVSMSECVQKSDGGTTYIDSQSGETKPLFGLVKINSICKVLTGIDLSDIDFETKSVGIYDFKQKKEVSHQLPVAVELINKDAQIGVLHVKENGSDKVEKDGKATWVKNDKVYEKNVINKVFDKEGFTAKEILAKVPEPKFVEAWLKANKDVVKDYTSKGGKSSGSKKEDKPKQKKPLF